MVQGRAKRRVRPDELTYHTNLAQDVSERGTCIRRAVGCVLVDEHKRILATGYNGASSGAPHCIKSPCAGATADSGRDLDKCVAIHAEQNALLQCREVRDIHTAYITTSPCITCIKLLKNTGCQRIVFAEKYAEPHYTMAMNEWLGHEPTQSIPSHAQDGWYAYYRKDGEVKQRAWVYKASVRSLAKDLLEPGLASLPGAVATEPCPLCDSPLHLDHDSSGNWWWQCMEGYYCGTQFPLKRKGTINNGENTAVS